MTQTLAPGAVVHAGIRTGHIVRAKRMHGQDGYVVQFPVRDQGDGTLPHWIPASGVHPGPMPTPGVRPLLSQAGARQAAAELNEDSATIYVAATVPLNCWGGTEQGWAVYRYPEWVRL